MSERKWKNMTSEPTSLCELTLLIWYSNVVAFDKKKNAYASVNPIDGVEREMAFTVLHIA